MIQPPKPGYRGQPWPTYQAQWMMAGRRFVGPATGYSLSGPSSGTVGTPSSAFSVALTPNGGTVAGTVTVTPSDSGAGGTFTPATVGLTTIAPSATFTYTAASAGTKTISVTNNGALPNPGNLAFGASGGALVDGNPISIWLDSSGNGHDATQSGTARPTFKTNILNGKPAVRFASASLQFLNITNPISGASPWTVFAVMRPAGGSGTVVLASLYSSGTGNRPFGPFENSDGNLYQGNRSTAGQVIALTLYSLWHIFEVVSNGTSTPLVAVDGAGVTVTNVASTGSGDWDRIATITSDGDIAELILYNVDVANPDAIGITKYLSDKYAITVASGGTAVQPNTVAGLVGWWKADSLG